MVTDTPVKVEILKKNKYESALRPTGFFWKSVTAKVLAQCLIRRRLRLAQGQKVLELEVKK